MARDSAIENVFERVCVQPQLGLEIHYFHLCGGSRIRVLREGVDVFVIIETHWRHEDSDMKSLEGSLVKSVCCSMISSVKIKPKEPERRGEMHQMVVTLGFL